MIDGFWKVCNAINRCGWLIIILHLFGWLIWYGFVHKINVDIVCASFLFGCAFAALVHRVTDLLEDWEDDNED